MASKKTAKATRIDIPDNAIETLTVKDIYNREKYDLLTMEEDDLFKLLYATREGLTDEDVNERLTKFGYNRLDYVKRSPLIDFLLLMWNPFSWVMILSALIVIIVSNGGGKPPDWQVFIGILLLILSNSIIGFVRQRNTAYAIRKIMNSSALIGKVKRNGEWKVVEADELVPGDIISLKSGDVIPADGRVIAVRDTILIDQSALTGESIPISKSLGDEILCNAICKQGEAEAIVIATGLQTFTSKIIKLIGNIDGMGHLQFVLTHIGNFRAVIIFILIVAEILVMYAGFRYDYRRGINNLLVLLIGGLPLAMINVLSIIFTICYKELSQHKIIVTNATAIEELAGVTILCLDKTGTLTLNKLAINKSSVKRYSDINIDDIIHYAALASSTENPDAIDACITSTCDDIKKIRQGIEELGFKPFKSIHKRTELTYKVISDGTVHRITKGMPHVILDLCKRDKTNQLMKQLNDDVDEFAQRGLRSLAVAIEDLPNGQIEGEGNGFKLIGLVPFHDSLCLDATETIDLAGKLGVRVKMITGDQLAIAKEIGRRLGIGDNMFLSRTLEEGPPSRSGYKDIDDLVLHADGFAGVSPEHKYAIVERLQNMGYMVAMIGDGVNDTPALRKSNVGVTVADACDEARSAADIILTEPGLSLIIKAILSSRKFFQRIRNYITYTCSITFRVLIGFSILVFAFKFDFPLFMIFILAILNDGTLVAIAKDHVEPSSYPCNWNLTEIVSYAFAYGIYLAASTIVFFSVIVKTTFFHEKFGVEQFQYRNSDVDNPGWNDPILHSIIYLQVSIINQALIFVIRSRHFFFMDRPSLILVCAFALAQLVATFIAVYANWSFTNIQGCGWSWAGIVWIWNILWFFPLDLIKFTLRAYFNRGEKKAADELLTYQALTARKSTSRESTDTAHVSGDPLSRHSSTISDNNAPRVVSDTSDIRHFSDLQTKF